MLPRRDRRLFDRRAIPLYAAALFAIMVCAVAVAGGAFTYDGRMVRELFKPVAFFLVIVWLVRWTGFEALAGFIEAALLGMFVGFVMTFCAAIFASAALPLADAPLAAADAALFGFHREALTAFTAGHGWFRNGMAWIYLSLGFTPQILLALLFFTGRSDWGWTFSVATTLALAAAVCLSWLLPAYGVPPYPYRFVEVLDGLRAGHLRRLDPGLVTGLVTFPSLHAADAAVLAWFYAKLGRLAWPFVLLNVLMVGSAVVVGGHYVVDVIAGLVIAAGAIWCAERLARPIRSASPPAAP